MHDTTSILRARAQEARYENLRELRDAAKEEVRKVVVGQDHAVELLLIAALAHGHVLIEGPPGSAKTLLARAMAHVLGSSFKRIQFTPDTTPTHIIGESIMKAGEPAFVPGPMFANVVLADEVNRTPARTQAAMLEAMQEHHVTVDGTQYRLPDPFLVIATQNPFEHEGIYPLPESQLDRFLFKIDLDYCDPESEVEMLLLPHLGIAPDMLGEIRPLLGVAGLDKARTEIDATVTPEPVLRYIVGLVRATREQSGVELGASSRAAIHLLAAAKAQARISGRDTIASSDVQTVAPYVLRHRLIVTGTTPQAVLREVMQAVPAP
ncbi:MAG TPA: MoxR family ATPase [Gaiellaceae bacterium]|nr:MoxR family ATPase [Gaiellaceae bacterium]